MVCHTCTWVTNIRYVQGKLALDMPTLGLGWHIYVDNLCNVKYYRGTTVAFEPGDGVGVGIRPPGPPFGICIWAKFYWISYNSHKS